MRHRERRMMEGKEELGNKKRRREKGCEGRREGKGETGRKER